MSSYQYRKSHSGDKTVVRSSYLHNGISYTGKMSSLYWIGGHIRCPLGIMQPCNSSLLYGIWLHMYIITNMFLLLCLHYRFMTQISDNTVNDDWKLNMWRIILQNNLNDNFTQRKFLEMYKYCSLRQLAYHHMSSWQVYKNAGWHI